MLQRILLAITIVTSALRLACCSPLEDQNVNPYNNQPPITFATDTSIAQEQNRIFSVPGYAEADISRLITSTMFIPSNTPAPTMTPSPTITPSPTLTPPLPRKVMIGVPLATQSYNLDCELAAAAMALTYFNPNPPEGYTTWEEYLVKEIPRDCNPYKGFRGSINGIASTRCDPPYGYGVYAHPIAKVLKEAGFEAQAIKGMTYGQLKQEIDKGHPVVVWISWQDKPVITETPENGTPYPLVYGEHAVLVIGYSEGPNGKINFYYNDPSGWHYSRVRFPRWEDFENMALVIKGLASPTSTPTPFSVVN